MPRVVSLLPAATDIVAALGRSCDLVGVTWECTVPAGAPADVRVVTRDLLAVDDRSDPAAVDAAVQAASQAREPLAAVDDEAIAPSAVVVEWVDPLFVGGHWIPDLVEAAGARCALGTPGGRSTARSWDEVAELDVDHVVVAPCGFDLDGAAAQAEAVLDRVPAGAAVWAIDADQLIVRPGPRLIEGAEVLAAAFAGRATDPARIRRIR